MQWRRDDFEVDTTLARVDFGVVNAFLTSSYWAGHRSPETNESAWRASHVVFGVYDRDGKQVGGARIVGDGLTFGWLADVFIIPEYQGRGLGKFLIDCVTKEPSCAATDFLVLGTRDAHGLYQPHGWVPLYYPDRWMQRNP